jgi:hypothetical protein
MSRSIFLQILNGSMLCFLYFSAAAYGQTDAEQRLSVLEGRVQAMEIYIQNLQPTLNQFSQELLSNVEQRVDAGTGKVIVLNPISKTFSKIVTNTGTFLISVQKVQKLTEGYRLYLHIGNPNAVTCSGLKLTLSWGKKWDPSFVKPSYEEWRHSLVGGEFSYPGDLPSGAWTEIAVDLNPASYDQLEYIECQMDINAIKMKNVDGGG